MHILVTAIGSFSADIVIKKLKEADNIVIGCDIYHKELIVDAYNVDKFYQAPLASNTKQYIDFIKKVCLENDIKYVFPLTDIEIDVLNNVRDWFIKNEIILCVSSKQTIDVCRNKKKSQELISKKCDVYTIPTMYLDEVKVLPYNFPIVCKLIDGRSSQGLKYIYNDEEWENFSKLTDNRNKYIVQPFISGNVVTCDIIRQIDSKTVVIPRIELLRTINGAGTSVYVFHDEKLENACRTIADILNIIGCVNFEFIKDEDGDYYFIECNPRFSGGVEFSCMVGYDLIMNHLKCFENKKIDLIFSYNNQFIARKYEEYVTKIEK